jgi:hypothetical protein
MLKKQYFSGICVCGHFIGSHHSGTVANTKFVEDNPWVKDQGYNIYDECVICNGVNGEPGLGDKTGHYCYGYFDVEDPTNIVQTQPRN